MCNPAFFMIGSALVSAYAQHQQGAAAAQVGRNNQMMANYAAQDAERRGEEDAIKVRQQADQLKGQQRARMAANGLDLTVGTPAEIQDQTDFFKLQDINTTRFNASREAWADRAQGANYNYQGQAARSQANLGAFSTVLGAAGRASQKWDQYGS